MCASMRHTTRARAPALLAGAAPPLHTPDDLQHHTLLQIETTLGTTMPLEWQSWLRGVGADEFEPAGLVTYSNYDAAVAAAVAGQGVLLGRRPLIDAFATRRPGGALRAEPGPGARLLRHRRAGLTRQAKRASARAMAARASAVAGLRATHAERMPRPVMSTPARAEPLINSTARHCNAIASS